MKTGYDSVQFESIETISQKDEIRAIELAQLIKSGQYMLNNSHVQEMTKISHNNDKKNTKNEKPTKIIIHIKINAMCAK